MNGPAEVRARIVDFLRRELIGPDPRPEHLELNQREEILRPQDPPRLRYSAGVLFPGTVRVEMQDVANADEVESASSGPPDGDEPEDAGSNNFASDTDASTDHEVNRANEFLPSAMGFTALVRLPGRLRVIVRAGRYEKKTQVGLGRQDKKGGWVPHHWRRPIEPAALEIDCAILRPTKALTKEYPLEVGVPDLQLGLHIYSRPYLHAQNPETDRIVTFTLINRTEMTGNSPKDSECLFQCEFKVQDADGSPCFLEYPEREGLDDDSEEQSLRLLYRHRKTFAIGHGCAALWPDSPGSAVSWIKTDSLPTHEIKPILPREIQGLDLSMHDLSDASAHSAVQTCAKLASEYKEWIELQSVSISSQEFPQEYRDTAAIHLELCRGCHQRILDGVELLQSDADTRLAFAWMNRAMLEQQLHYDLAANFRRTWSTQTGIPHLETPYSPPTPKIRPKGRGGGVHFNWRSF